MGEVPVKRWVRVARGVLVLAAIFVGLLLVGTLINWLQGLGT